jgi:hypothetical protein
MVRNVVVLVVCALALTLSSCGRQVTPDRTNSPTGLQPGQIEIKYTMANPVDFVNDWYVLAFDVTCTPPAQTCTPYAQYGTQNTGWFNWDYEIVVYQPNSSSGVQVAMYAFVNQQTTNGSQKYPFPVQAIQPLQLNVITNCSGPNQFCVIFNRSLFNGNYVQGTSATPPVAGNTWYVNWIVASPSGNPQGQAINAPGQLGPNDTTFAFPSNGQGLDVTTAFDQRWTALAPPAWNTPPNPAAQYQSGEVINNP